MELNFFPWDKGEKPYFVNEEGFEWYIDEALTKYPQRQSLDLVCFYVKKDKLLTRVLMDKKNNILHEDTSFEGMGCHIDMLKLVKKLK